MSEYMDRQCRYLQLDVDKHQQALWRLAAVSQYLYDTMAGDSKSDRPEPLPGLAMDAVRQAQACLDRALMYGARTRPRKECSGGQIELVERVGPMGIEAA